MPFYHVISKVGPEDSFRCLFSDLSAEALHQRFIKPYENGTAFFSGNDLISPSDLRSLQIIRTARPDEVERDEINRKGQERIDRINDSSWGVFIISTGGGYEPQDIAEAGEDLTRDLIKGPPGFKAGRRGLFKKVFGWAAGIASAVVAAGVIKWLGWL